MRATLACLGLLVLAPVAASGTAAAATTDPVYACSGRITTALRSYTEDFFHATAGCRVKLLRSPGDGCAANLEARLDNLASDVRQQIAGCDAHAARALCALEARAVLPDLQDAISGTGEHSLRSTLAAVVDDLFVTRHPSCPRPVGATSNDLRECADRLAQSTERVAEQLEQCFFSCERANLIAADREPCVDDITGGPLDGGVAECVARKTAGLADVAARCDDAGITALGCPLGATGVADLVDRLATRLERIARALNVGVFHARCQGALPGQPTEPVPAVVTLEPEMIRKTVSCGTVIDAAFMGRNSRLSFDTDLDCGPSLVATDGIVVARSGITISGRLRSYGIRGPRRSSLRTGAGIRLAPGASRVRIVNLRTIENFGVGIEDAVTADNRKVVIQKTTVRRNVQAGIRVRSSRARIEQVIADRNGIGFDLSGDGGKLKASVAKRSPYEPRIGIRLAGEDRNANGSVVVVDLCTAEENEGVGIEIASGAHVLMQNTVRANVGDGIVVLPEAQGSRIDSNVVKLNARGIVVFGDGNRVASNTCEENLGPGFLVSGLDNEIEQNKSGKKTNRGNAGGGFEISGPGTRLYANQAEANGGAGFVVTTTTAQMKANGAQNNGGAGFEVQSADNSIEACAAEANAGFEWVLAAGNTDRGGNKVNGRTFAIPAAGGTCEQRGLCDALAVD